MGLEHPNPSGFGVQVYAGLVKHGRSFSYIFPGNCPWSHVAQHVAVEPSKGTIGVRCPDSLFFPSDSLFIGFI